jgi:hypothetical protein
MMAISQLKDVPPPCAVECRILSAEHVTFIARSFTAVNIKHIRHLYHKLCGLIPFIL